MIEPWEGSTPRHPSHAMAVHVYFVEKEFAIGRGLRCVWKYGLTTQANYKARNTHYKECFRWEELPSVAQAKRFEAQMQRLVHAWARDKCTPRVLNRILVVEEFGKWVPFDVAAACWDVAFERVASGLPLVGWRGISGWDEPELDRLDAAENEIVDAMVKEVGRRAAEFAVAAQACEQLGPMWA
jgi:hypothetical protein